MAVTFHRTLRSLRTDHQAWGWVGLALLLVAAAALVWVFLAEVTVYEVSSFARLEVRSAPQSLTAEVEGRVVESRLHIGLETAAGDVLVTLDGESVRRSIDELRQQITATRLRLEAIRREIDVKQQSLVAQAKARELAVQESQAQLEVAETRARFSQQSFQRASKLAAKSAVATEELERTRSEAETTQALVRAARLTLARGEQDRLAEERQQEAELASVQQEAVKLEGDLAVHDATLRRLTHELDFRSIRAYVAGRVEEVVPFRIGTVVHRSEKLADSSRVAKASASSWGADWHAAIPGW